MGNILKEIKMQERIPLSEIEKLKIEYSPGEEDETILPDENGILSWNIKLKPYERRIINLKYLIHKHNSIVNFPV
jgi:hypothetical protein